MSTLLPHGQSLRPAPLNPQTDYPSGHGVVASTLPPCQSSGIDDWLDTKGGAAAGTIFYHLEFTNLSGHACTLQGFRSCSR
jgi:hypothetical protein